MPSSERHSRAGSRLLALQALSVLALGTVTFIHDAPVSREMCWAPPEADPSVAAKRAGALSPRPVNSQTQATTGVQAGDGSSPRPVQRGRK